MTTASRRLKRHISEDLVYFIQERMWRLDRNAHTYREDFASYIVEKTRVAVTDGWFVAEDRIEELIRGTDPEDPPPEWLSTVRAGPAWKETHAALRRLVRHVETGITAEGYNPTEEEWRRRYVPMISGRYALLCASDSLRRATADVVDDARLFRRRIFRLADRDVPVFQDGHVVDTLLVSALLAREWPRVRHKPYSSQRPDREGAVALAVFGNDYQIGFTPERWALRALSAGASVRKLAANKRLITALRKPTASAERRSHTLAPLLVRAGVLDSP